MIVSDPRQAHSSITCDDVLAVALFLSHGHTPTHTHSHTHTHRVERTRSGRVHEGQDLVRVPPRHGPDPGEKFEHVLGVSVLSHHLATQPHVKERPVDCHVQVQAEEALSP